MSLRSFIYILIFRMFSLSSLVLLFIFLSVCIITYTCAYFLFTSFLYASTVLYLTCSFFFFIRLVYVALPAYISSIFLLSCLLPVSASHPLLSLCIWLTMRVCVFVCACVTTIVPLWVLSVIIIASTFS